MQLERGDWVVWQGAAARVLAVGEEIVYLRDQAGGEAIVLLSELGWQGGIPVGAEAAEIAASIPP